jgi:hypothetical protein
VRSLYPETVERLRAGLVDGYGGVKVRDWGNAATVTLPASVQPVSTTEDTTARQTTVERWRLRTPLTSDLVPTDRVRWRGRVLEVDGEVELWDPTRPRHGHKAAFLRLATDI